MTQDKNPTEQEVFVLYLQRVPPVSPAIRLEDGGESWWGRLHHLLSGEMTTLHGVDDLLPAINRYIQGSRTPTQKQTGLK